MKNAGSFIRSGLTGHAKDIQEASDTATKRTKKHDRLLLENDSRANKSPNEHGCGKLNNRWKHSPLGNKHVIGEPMDYNRPHAL